ncbi:SpoIIE family protein phosphatase [Streptomyces sp. Tu 2975]|uniref:SpoIIE family protein phosphatase n=1 Tax=Streptomyces sp. Tu 2975 TaxID=2676871 RepID=UPI0013572772|nr:SpoIIE family protein phosphatase [Streptomyces sp. Tu 2975]QIP87888.1 SpoIIE family protein phosphatase [Streptomyces sp. Tu 2975]
MSIPGELRSKVLEAMFSQSPIGLHVVGPDLRVLRVNSGAVGMHGVPPSAVVGRPLTEVYARFDPDKVESAVRKVLATGEPVLDLRVRGCPLVDPDREHVFSASIFRLEDDDGLPIGVVAAAVDITHREHARERLSVMHQARRRIGPSLDPLHCAQSLVEVAVPVLADVAAVALTDAVLHSEDSAALPDGRPRLRWAATCPGGASQAPVVGEAADQAVFDDVVRRPEPRVERSENSNVLVAPLVCRGVPLGVAWFRRPDNRGPFEDEDVRLAMNLASHTALCIDNARRYEQAHAVALALQGHLLRPSLVRQGAVDVAHRYRPTGRGAGAWFDIVPLAGARIAMAVGQVDGQGPEAAAAMVQLRSAVHALSALDLEPHDVVARLNDTVRRLDEERSSARDSEHLTAGCVYAIHDPVTSECSIARAGRQRLLVGGPDGTWNDVPLSETPELGEDGPPFAADEFSLPAGSILVLSSGHVPDEGLLGRLHEATAAGSKDVVADMLPDDQAAVLVARTRALDPADVASWDIPAELSSVSEARRRALDRLGQWHLDEAALATELIVSELVTNAIRHGRPPVRLRLVRNAVHHTLTCEVLDSSPSAPHLRHARAGDEGGRGLFICGELADRWGVRWSDQGKTVWTEAAVGT